MNIRIAQAFSKAATTYDIHAKLQKQVACELTKYLEKLPEPKTILEIGCGTGFLTRQVLSKYTPDFYLATDISKEMLMQCHDIKNPGLMLKIMDGENPTLSQKFDLILANFVFQWFLDFETSVTNLMKHGDYLAFSTLGPATFHEWRDLTGRTTHQFTSLKTIENLFPKAIYLERKTVCKDYKNWRMFWQTIKNIGAHKIANLCQQPIPFKQLRKIFEQDQEKVSITYEIIYCLVGKS